MNSGYSPVEVQEASKFLGGGVLNAHQPKPEEQLTMPNKKPGIFSKLKQKQAPQIQPTKQQTQQPIQSTKQPTQTPVSTQQQTQQTQQTQQSMQPLQQNSKPLTKQLQGIKPKTKSHLKEIMLVVILLILIGVLVTTIFLKDTIIGWFS
jgi:preprotein translocase subunit SecF